MYILVNIGPVTVDPIPNVVPYHHHAERTPFIQFIRPSLLDNGALKERTGQGGPQGYLPVYSNGNKH
jgi:hypothetical protein